MTFAKENLKIDVFKNVERKTVTISSKYADTKEAFVIDLSLDQAHALMALIDVAIRSETELCVSVEDVPVWGSE